MVKTVSVARRRPLAVTGAVACVLVIVVLAVIPFLAAVSEAVSPGSIPQLAPLPGTPPTDPGVAWVVVVVRGLIVVTLLTLALSAWRGRGRFALVVVLVVCAALDLLRAAVAGPVTVPLQLLGAALLLTRSAQRWTGPRPDPGAAYARGPER